MWRAQQWAVCFKAWVPREADLEGSEDWHGGAARQAWTRGLRTRCYVPPPRGYHRTWVAPVSGLALRVRPGHGSPAMPGPRGQPPAALRPPGTTPNLHPPMTTALRASRRRAPT